MSYEDAATLSEFWEMAAQFDRSFYRELIDHWDERGYDEYIVAAKGCLPYCESPEEYVCRMETRREIFGLLAPCTEKQRERFCIMLCTISAMRKSERSAAAPKARWRSRSRPSKNFSKILEKGYTIGGSKRL